MLLHTSWIPATQQLYRHNVVRWFSSSRKKVIGNRTMQKQLYGGVVKADNGKRFVPIVKHKIESNLEKSSELSSEYFWTVQRYPQSKNVKVFSSNDADTAQSRNDSNATESQQKQSQRQLSHAQIIKSTTTSLTHTPIPFSDNELQAILKYPMVCAKADTTQMEQLLYDRSIRLPSISRILQATMSDAARAALKKWKLNKIDELGYDGFQQYQQEILTTGKQFHAALELYLTDGETPGPSSPVIKLWDSLSGHLSELKPDPVLIEKPILHTHLKYQGIVDNVSFIE